MANVQLAELMMELTTEMRRGMVQDTGKYLREARVSNPSSRNREEGASEYDVSFSAHVYACLDALRNMQRSMMLMDEVAQHFGEVPDRWIEELFLVESMLFKRRVPLPEPETPGRLYIPSIAPGWTHQKEDAGLAERAHALRRAIVQCNWNLLPHDMRAEWLKLPPEKQTLKSKWPEKLRHER